VYDLRNVFNMKPLYPLYPQTPPQDQRQSYPVSSTPCKANTRHDLEEKLAQRILQDVIECDSAYASAVPTGEPLIDVERVEEEAQVLEINLNDSNDDDWQKRLNKHKKSDRDESDKIVDNKKVLKEVPQVGSKEQIGSAIKCDKGLLQKYPNLLDDVNLEDLVNIVVSKTDNKGVEKVKKENVEVEDVSVTVVSENHATLTKDVVVFLRPLQTSKEQAGGVGKEIERKENNMKLPLVSSKNKRKSIEDGEIFSEIEDGEIEEIADLMSIQTRALDDSGLRRSTRIQKQDSKPDYTAFENDGHARTPRAYGVTYGYGAKPKLNNSNQGAKKLKR